MAEAKESHLAVLKDKQKICERNLERTLNQIMDKEHEIDRAKRRKKPALKKELRELKRTREKIRRNKHEVIQETMEELMILSQQVPNLPPSFPKQ